MHKDKIDDIFNDGLKNQKFEISDAFLVNLESRLDKKKKKGIIFWLSSVGFFILLLIFTGYSIIHFNDKQIVKSNNNVNELNIGINSNTVETTQSLKNKKDNKIISYERIESKNEFKNQNKKSIVSTSIKVKKDNNVVKKITKSKLISVVMKYPDIDKEIKKRASKNRLNNTVTTENDKNSINDLLNLVNKKYNSTDTKVVLTDNFDSLVYDETDNQTLNSYSTLNFSDDTLQSNLKSNDGNQKIENNTINTIKSTKNDSSITQVLEVTNQNDSILSAISPDDNSKNSNKPNNTRLINILISAESGYNFISSKYKGLESDYYQSNTLENNTINYGLDINVLLKNKFLIGSGIGYNQQKYTYDFNTTFKEYHTTVTTTTESIYVFEYYIYQQGVIIDSVYHYDDNEIITTVLDSTESATNYSNLTFANYISIPLNIGYNYTYKKLMLGFVLSAKYNYLQNINGGYYSNNTFTTFDNTTNPQFKKAYFSYAIKGNIAYNIFKDLYLHSSFSFSPYSKTVFKTPNLERKVRLSNVSFGLTYKI